MLIATRTCCSTCAHDCTAAVLPHTNRSNLRGRAVPAPTPTCEPPLPVSFLWMRPHQGLACPMARFNTSHLTVRPGGQCPPLRPPAPAVPSATVSPMRSILRQTTTHRIRQIAGIRRLRNDVGESIALPLGCKTLREPNALPLYAYRLDACLTLQRQRQVRCP